MTGARKFPQIEYGEASGGLRSIYDDIQGTLRVPWVAFFCRVIAIFPGYLQLAWRAARPNFGIRYAERASDQLRLAALMPNEEPPDLRRHLEAMRWEEARIAEIRRALDALNYGNAKYILLVTAWTEAFQERMAGGGRITQQDSRPLPGGIPVGMPKLELVDPGSAPADVTRLFKHVTDLHHWHDVSSDYRVLANWPDFLKLALDEVLEPVIGSEGYDLTTLALLRKARELVLGFPTPAGVSRRELRDLSSLEVAALTALLTMFQRYILELSVDMVRLKQALDGTGAAMASPFPVD